MFSDKNIRVKEKPPGFYYGWVIVGVSFFTLFIAVGVRLSFSVFFIAILKEYGWSRAETAGAFSLAMIVHGLFAPITGSLIDRFGPRRLFPLGSGLLILGLLAASRIAAVWQLYLFFGVMVAIGINTLSYSPHMSLIPRWFVRKRGLAAGLVLAGIGMGALFIVPAVELVIDSLGWRWAFLVLAGIVMVTLVPLTLVFHRNSPEEVGQFPDGEAPIISPSEKEGEDHRGALPRVWTLADALGTWEFWCMMLVLFCNGFMMNMLVVHQAIYLVDVGYSTIAAASMVGLVGLLGSIGGILCGHLSDRAGRELVYTLGSALAFAGGICLMLLSEVPCLWLLAAFVTFYGIGYGSFGPITASISGDFFPGKSLGRILAIQSMAFGLGGATGPFLGGYFHDRTGSYMVPFLFLLISILLGTLAVWMAKARYKGRK